MASIDPTFRAALAEYESKNYKRSVQHLDKLIKKNPNHGGAYALKALVLANSEPSYRSAPQDDDESTTINKQVRPNYASFCPLTNETFNMCEELIKKAEKNGGKDPMACHIAALFYRHAKKYDQAAKFYALSMTNGSSNYGILRDLSSCWSQMRKWDLVPGSRLNFLKSQPGFRANHTSTAVAYDFNEQYNEAIDICNKIEDIIADKLIDDDKYEHSSLLVYKIVLLIKAGEVEKALKNIDELILATDKFRCYDIQSLLELRVKLLFGKSDDLSLNEAQRNIRQLIRRNPDNIEYYKQLFYALSIETDYQKKLTVCKKLSEFYPKSDIPKFLPLTFLPVKSDEFKFQLTSYLQEKFKRGVPAVFSTIKPLYQIHDTHEIIFEIVTKFEKEAEVENPLNPLTLTWIKYFIAQHYYRLELFENSISKIDEAIKITPTLLELKMYKARILKKKGLLIEAAKEMNSARLMDLQDRFVNTRAAKYYLRADMIKEAIDTISLFTKNYDDKTGIRDLHCMQCCWFVSELSQSLTRIFHSELTLYISHKDTPVEEDLNSDEISEESIDPFHSKPNEHSSLSLNRIATLLSLAIQRYQSLFWIFLDYKEDEFDFHHYSMRKGTPNSYHEMIKWGDELMKQPLLTKAYYNLMDLISFITNFASDEEKQVIELAIVEAGYSPVSKKGKLRAKKHAGSFKKSKKDKRFESKWKNSILDYSRVDETDALGLSLLGGIIFDEEFNELDKIHHQVKGEDWRVLKGEWDYEVINGKWVAGLAVLRKLHAISKNEIKNPNEDTKSAQLILEEVKNRMFEFVQKPSGDDKKLESVKKLVKLGLDREFA
ncbi:peptide alpha-N-acetyltransferase complex A subunit [Martiniozyma asiatica (nom. inval.)]|nr:peptide alpha-N-acetyltransferase complex A subunit [Martiniozyma asiatica]